MRWIIMNDKFWKKDWQQAKKRLTKWWQGNGIVLSITAPRDKPLLDIDKPKEPDTLEKKMD